MHARPFSTFALTLLALVSHAAAQRGDAPKPAPKPAVEQPAPSPASQDPVAMPTADVPKPMERDLDAMRQQLVEGRTYRSHVRVTVRLKNGNRVTGIVKDGFVVERVDGVRFVESEANEPGAGVRIYTYSGKRNYVFLSFSEMDEYRINQRMTTAELLAYERRMRESEAAAQKKREQTEAEEQQPVPSVEVEGANAPVELQPATDEPAAVPAKPKKTPSVTDELQAMYALLQDYPPAEGWNEQKRDEIARRRAVVGANPSPKEQKFVEKFAEWQRACSLLGAKTPADQGQSTTEESGSGSRRRKNR